jgi:hypothetical protein
MGIRSNSGSESFLHWFYIHFIFIYFYIYFIYIFYIFFFFIFLSYNLSIGASSSVKKLNFLLKFCVEMFLCRHYFSPLNIFMRKRKDPNPDPYL